MQCLTYNKNVGCSPYAMGNSVMIGYVREEKQGRHSKCLPTSRRQALKIRNLFTGKTMSSLRL